jgi:polyphosphate kinase
MHRNMFRRNESCFEIRQKAMKEQIRRDLDLFLSDNCQAGELSADGTDARLSPGEDERVCAQDKFLEELAGPKLIPN